MGEGTAEQRKPLGQTKAISFVASPDDVIALVFLGHEAGLKNPFSKLAVTLRYALHDCVSRAMEARKARERVAGGNGPGSKKARQRAS